VRAAISGSTSPDSLRRRVSAAADLCEPALRRRHRGGGARQRGHAPVRTSIENATTARARPVTVRAGINGFGRIGRNFFRAVLAQGTDIEVVGINDLTSNDVLAHMLKYDSVLGRLDAQVSFDDNNLIVNGKAIRATAEADPAQLPWGELGADIVIESTWRFTKAE